MHIGLILGWGCICAMACIEALAAGQAMPRDGWRFTPVSHELGGAVNQTIRRIVGQVKEPGPRNENGHIYSLQAVNFAISPGEAVGWRMQILTGALAGRYYRVVSNTQSEVSIMISQESLDGIAAGDLMILEQIYERVLPPRR